MVEFGELYTTAVSPLPCGKVNDAKKPLAAGAATGVVKSNV